jgi:DNA-binding NarL/FixJ family response regulator
MGSADTAVLIVSRMGPLSDGLQALVSVIPRVGTVGRVEQISSVPELLAEQRVALLLIDSSLMDDDGWPCLQRIRTEWPALNSIVLADDARTQRQAVAAGVSAVFLKGVPAARLSATIERLLANSGGAPPVAPLQGPAAPADSGENPASASAPDQVEDYPRDGL